LIDLPLKLTQQLDQVERTVTARVVRAGQQNFQRMTEHVTQRADESGSPPISKRESSAKAITKALDARTRALRDEMAAREAAELAREERLLSREEQQRKSDQEFQMQLLQQQRKADQEFQMLLLERQASLNSQFFANLLELFRAMEKEK